MPFASPTPSISQRRVNRGNPCPVCQKTSECYYTSDGLAVVCTRVESDHPIRDEIKGTAYLHRLDGAAPRPRPALAMVPGGQAARRDPAHLDRVYRALLRVLTLSPADREALRARNMTDAEIDAGLYRSGPVRDRGTLARRLCEDLGDDALRGVPGIYIDAGRYGDYWSLRAASGLLVPVSDEQGRIVGMQVRRSGDGPGPRYVWLSSKDMRGGASPGAPLGWFGAAGGAGQLWVTEGPVKAAIAASRLGARVVAVPGVGAWRSAGLVERVRAGGYTEVVIAYDADAAANVQVAREAHGLCEAMVTAGVRVSFAVWDPVAGKGIDDLLVAGGQPEIVSPRDWAERLPDEVRQKARIGTRHQVLRVPATLLPPPDKPQRVWTVEDARADMGQRVEAFFAGAEGATIMSAQCGLGKTTTARDKAEAAFGNWLRVPRDQRVLYLTRTQAAIEEFLDHAGPRLQLSAYVASGPTDPEAVWVQGRSPDPTSPAYCARYAEAVQHGAQRQSVAANLCRIGSTTEGEDQRECPYAQQCPYLQLRRQAEQARLVLATYHSYINAGDDIEHFDAIVIDEDVVPDLVEVATLTEARIAEWTAVANHLQETRTDADFQQHLLFSRLLLPQSGICGVVGEA